MWFCGSLLFMVSLHYLEYRLYKGRFSCVSLLFVNTQSSKQHIKCIHWTFLLNKCMMLVNLNCVLDYRLFSFYCYLKYVILCFLLHWEMDIFSIFLAFVTEEKHHFWRGKEQGRVSVFPKYVFVNYQHMLTCRKEGACEGLDPQQPRQQFDLLRSDRIHIVGAAVESCPAHWLCGLVQVSSFVACKVEMTISVQVTLQSC